MDLQWAAEQAQAAEKEWQDAHKEAGRMGGGPPTHNWPENKLDNFTASYPGASNYQSLKVMNGDQEEYQCDECSSVYGKISGIANHKEKVHGAEGKLYKCILCGFTTQVYKDLTSHKRLEHGARHNHVPCDSCP